MARFVGRRVELERLLLLGTPTTGKSGPHVAVVIGDPGSGKTRLLEEFLRHARLERRTIITGYEPEQQAGCDRCQWALDLVCGLEEP